MFCRHLDITKYLIISVFYITGLFLPTQIQANDHDSKACIAKAIETADDDTTVGEIKSICAREKVTVQSAVEARMEIEKENRLEPFTIMAHRPNYLLFAAYNEKGYSAQEFNDANPNGSSDISLDYTEAQFQISLKAPLGINLFNKNIDVFGGYTVRSFWQAYNSEESSAFRETNHEPEIWFQTYPNWKLFGFKNSVVQFGLNHQSNGRNGPVSRSWNRVFAQFVFEKDNFVIGFKPWYRLPEDAEDDENPDITDFLGHFEIGAAYKRNNHVFSFMSRNNLESGFDKGAVEAGWSFPLGKWPYLKGYVQYFHGYGESLIDYDQKVNRIGLGIMLGDYL